MNRNILSSIMLWMLLSFIIFSCDKDKEQSEIDYFKFKEIAWNSLAPASKEIVLHDWIDAEAVMTKNPDSNKDVIMVFFHTPYDALTCPISVYVDIDTEEVIYPENRLKCN